MALNAANANLQYSQTGLQFTEQSEGDVLTAYQDVAGVWTIGYGHTQGVYAGMTCTQLQAVAWLVQDLQWAEQAVLNLVTIALTQGEFDALVDFVFNFGSGAFAGSTLLRLLNADDIAGAAAQFVLWDHAGGKVVAGLLRRRMGEQAEFTSGETQ